MVARIKKLNFELYRYQILPLTQKVQLDALLNISGIESLKEQKNKFFMEMLTSLKRFEHRNKVMKHKFLFKSDEWAVFLLGARKSIEVSTTDFESQEVEDWPYVMVIINNHPERQGIAISRNWRAFQNNDTVASVLEKTFQTFIKKYQLIVFIEAIFEKSSFWQLVEEYEGRIREVDFELISPNMANISKALKIDLAQINKDTNSQKVDLRLNSHTDSNLEISRDNTTINSLVDYSSEGGGDITLKIRGLNKKIRTSRTNKEVSVEEIEFRNPTPELLATFRKFFT